MRMESRRAGARRGVPALAVIAAIGAPMVFAAVLAGPAPALAQPTAPAATDAGAGAARIIAAFDAIGERAAEGAWQRADAAYNEALAAIDGERPALEAALGDPARVALADAERLLPDLEAALTDEDLVRLNIAIAAIQARIGALAPGVTLTAVPASIADTVLAWRDAVAAAVAKGRAGQWIEMRNAMIEVNDDIARQADPVVRAAPGAQGAMDRARIFGQRLFIAALDQSPADTDTGAALVAEAIDAILVQLGALPAPSPTPSGAQARFRVFEVRAAAGEIVAVPILGQAIPQIGLGSLDLRVRWSPTALRLVDVAWEAAAGRMVRDDVAGVAALVLPQAPTGPAGNPILATLQFEVRSGTVEARQYLPREEVAELETAISDAQRQVRLGDLPKTAKALAGAYAMLAAGRSRPDSLYARLDRAGLATPLADRVLAVLDLAIAPAEADRILVGLDELQDAWTATQAGYLTAITAVVDVPVSLDVIGATDTLGGRLALMAPLDGGVVVTSAAVPDGGTSTTAAPATAPPAVAPAAAAGATVPSLVITGTVPAGGGGQGRGGSPAPGFPRAVVVMLVAAFAIGGAAAAWASRRGAAQDGRDAG